MIIKKSLSEQIYEDLKKDIFEQKIRFGEKLVNRELQQRYGVSSTPVRDAINRLHQDGLLQSISQGGARVIDFEYTYAQEINEIISMLNCTAMELSAKRGEREAVADELDAIIQKQEEYINTDRYFEYDQKFHNVFFRHSQNKCLLDLHAQYGSLYQLLFRFYYRDAESRRDRSIIMHKQITQQFRAGRVEEAVKFMAGHFDKATQPLENALTHPAEQPQRTGKPQQ